MNSRHKNEHLSYYEKPKDSQNASQQNHEDDYQDENKNFSKQHNHKKPGKKYVNLLYFIDDNGEVQVVHKCKDFKNLAEQQKGLGAMNEYYRSHIKSKIGHPDRGDK